MDTEECRDLDIFFILSILTIMPPNTTYNDLFQGHDVNILEDMLSHTWRPPILWVEWFIGYRMKSDNRSEGGGIPEVNSNNCNCLFLRLP